MIDALLRVFKKDPLIKRNIVKTISWRVAGSLDTVILGSIITGNLSTGARLGMIEMFTKMLLFYFHERLWQRVKFGLPSKQQQTQTIRQQIKPNLFKQTGKVTRHDREVLNRNPSFTLWFTGLSGAGKSTIATELEAWIHHEQGNVYILDGDNTRLGINSDLSFSDEDRTENIRRVAEVCRLFNDAGVIVIASFISPFEQDRQTAKKLIGTDSFVEVFVDSSLDVCKQRDTKGLYKLALSGKIKCFTGIDSPYEAPLAPQIHLRTDKDQVEECVRQVKHYLSIHKHIAIRNKLIV